MAAAVFTGVKSIPTAEVFGQQRVAIFTVTCDTGDYATNGFTLPTNVAPSAWGISNFNAVIVTGGAGYVAEYVPATKKVKVYQQTNPGAAGGADIPLIEHAAGPLVAATFQFIAFGV